MPLAHVGRGKRLDGSWCAEDGRPVPDVVERNAKDELHREAHHVVGDCAGILKQETAFDGNVIGVEARLIQYLSEQFRCRCDVFAQDGHAETEEIGTQRRRDRTAQRLHREGERCGIVPQPYHASSPGPPARQSPAFAGVSNWWRGR